MAAAIAFTSVRLFTTQIREDRAKAAEGAARIAAEIIDGDKVEGWFENGMDDEYYKTSDALYNVLSNTAYLEYLYVYQIREDGCHVLFDYDTDSVPADFFGTVIDFDESFMPYIPTLLEGGRIDLIESNDSFGWLLTQYEPIYDSNGRCVAYAGADIAMTEVREYIHRFVRQILLITLIFLAGCIAVGFKLSVSFHRADEMDLMIERQKRDKELLREIIESFAKVIDLKDSYTQGHSTRVAKYTAMLAKELGYDEDTVEKYYNIALMHDIGKIGIPDSVLNKQGKLTDDEFSMIKSHTSRGNETLKNISLMPEIAIGAFSHHERYDGKGYPNHLHGGDIPRVAQIIGVADTFDAMYSDRPYRKRMNFEKVVSVIKAGSGTQLAPDVVDAFLRLVDKGEFRAPDDDGGGTTESIENIRNDSKNDAADGGDNVKE